jgi:hypothetical protein
MPPRRLQLDKADGQASREVAAKAGGADPKGAAAKAVGARDAFNGGREVNKYGAGGGDGGTGGLYFLDAELRPLSLSTACGVSEGSGHRMTRR